MLRKGELISFLQASWLALSFTFLLTGALAAAVTEDFEAGDPGLEAGNIAGSSFSRVQIDTDGDGAVDNWVLSTSAPGGWGGNIAKLPLNGTPLLDELRSALADGGTLSYDVYVDSGGVTLTSGDPTPGWFESVLALQTGWSDTANGTFPSIWDQELSNPMFTIPSASGTIEMATFTFPIKSGDTATAAGGSYENSKQFELLDSADPSYPATGPPNMVPFEWANLSFGNNNEAAAVSSATLYFDNIVITAGNPAGDSAVCDFDVDGDCDPKDLDEMYGNWGGSDLKYDLDGNDLVDSGDIAVWLEEASDDSNPFNSMSKTFVIGDTDFDGDVDSTDLGSVLNNYNDDSSLLYRAGNLNDNVSVDSADLGLLLNKFGYASSGPTAAVPEPSGMLLLLLGVASAVRLVRRFGVISRRP